MKIRRDRLRLFKFLSPLLSAFILLAVFFWPSQTATLGEYSKSTLNLKNEIKSFKLRGSLNNKNTYTLISKSGEDKGDGLIELDAPNLELQMENGQFLNIKADRATFDEKRKKLMIKSRVQARHSLGYFFEAPQAEITFD